MLDIRQEPWDLEAQNFLAPACTEDYTVLDLEYDVTFLRCQLFNIYEDDKHVGSMVLRLEKTPTGKELVVVALGGKNGGDLIQALTNFWDGLASLNGAKTIRAHVSKKGMARLMERAGGKLSEYVYKREVV